MKRIARAAGVLVATLAVGSVAHVSRAESPSPAASASVPERPAAQGVAVLALGSNAQDGAFALARAIYGSRLRPTSLDEVRARVLAGGAPPPNASRELRELAEVRAAVTGEDAASRRLLSGIARQIGATALLVVKVETPPAGPAPAPAPSGAGAQSGVGADAGTDAGPVAEDGGAATTPSENAAARNTGGAPTVVARLLLAESGDFDAARYSPEPGAPGNVAAWKSTVTSLEGRFPAALRVSAPAAATRPAPLIGAEDGKSTPFYASGWFWGALGGAALVGAAFYFASRDTSSDSIHLQMQVPK